MGGAWLKCGGASLAIALTLALPAAAQADFPYAPGGDSHDPSTFKLAPGVAPNDFSETGDWEFTATPENSPLSATVNNKQDELCGIRGGSIVDTETTQPTGCKSGDPVHTAWQVTTGRPDVTIAVLDSGIKWNDQGAMTDLRVKVRLDAREFPAPENTEAATRSGARC